MTITPDLFGAFLKCPTKCWLRAAQEPASGNAYAEWVKSQNEAYRAAETERLLSETAKDESVVSPTTENLKTAQWRLAVRLIGRTQEKDCDLETQIQAVERVPSEGRGKPAKFIPICFIFTNKLDKDDKLMLGFDAFVISQMLGREAGLGKIIHGDDHATIKVKTSASAGEVRERLGEITALLASPTPPDLILNRHCVECEFQASCRKLAVEKDDLSLLAGMSAKERQKLRSKGIFTVNQLSYTFRPHRRPKLMREKKEKYHHALKALAIREKKIHIAGSPEVKIEGTPVYLDVEGLPDRDFYYLIGVRIGNGDSAVQHSLWADTVEDEGKIWRKFLAILETVEKPVLIHYGSYETEFLATLNKRYGSKVQDQPDRAAKLSTLNLVSQLFGEIYFPTLSNGLKDIGAWLGFSWAETSPVGVNSLVCRYEWERTRNPSLEARLTAYNVEDCQAAERVTQAIIRLHASGPNAASPDESHDAVHVKSLKRPQRRWGMFVSPFKELEEINAAASWDYQRDRIYVKSAKAVKRAPKVSGREQIKWWKRFPAKRVIFIPDQESCPFCGGGCEVICRCNRILYDLSFGRTSVKRWIASTTFH